MSVTKKKMICISCQAFVSEYCTGKSVPKPLRNTILQLLTNFG